MNLHSMIIAGLLVIAVSLAILCSIGLLLSKDAYQKLHFSGPVVSISVLCITIAVFLHNHDWQARIKMALIALTLLFMNAVLSHATARAFAIRNRGAWIDPTLHGSATGTSANEEEKSEAH